MIPTTETGLPPAIDEAYHKLFQKMEGKGWTYFQLRSKGDRGKWQRTQDANHDELVVAAKWHI